MQVKDSTGKFNGNPHEFGKVRNKIITGLRVANGFDIAMGTEIPPAPPAELANNPSAAERTAHNGATDRFVKQQADFQRRTGLAFGAITDHICDDILGAFEKTEGDPAKAYKLFLSFGPAEDSATDEIYWFNALMSLKMTHSDFFDAFISRFDVAKEKSKTRDAPSTELLRKAMPERLATEVKHTSMSKMDYAATKAFLRTEDSTWHAKNSGPMENSKKDERKTINKVSKAKGAKAGANDEDSDASEPEKPEFLPDVVCFNCNNNGHYASDCKAKYCGKCGTAGHRSDKCKKKRTKARRVVKYGQREFESEDESEYSGEDFSEY